MRLESSIELPEDTIVEPRKSERAMVYFETLALEMDILFRSNLTDKHAAERIVAAAEGLYDSVRVV